MHTYSSSFESSLFTLPTYLHIYPPTYLPTYLLQVSRKGSPPSAMSGATMVAYKTIALSFGGVWDEEGKQHAMSSTFYADLHQFDMVRR